MKKYKLFHLLHYIHQNQPAGRRCLRQIAADGELRGALPPRGGGNAGAGPAPGTRGTPGDGPDSGRVSGGAEGEGERVEVQPAAGRDLPAGTRDAEPAGRGLMFISPRLTSPLVLSPKKRGLGDEVSRAAPSKAA